MTVRGVRKDILLHTRDHTPIASYAAVSSHFDGCYEQVILKLYNCHNKTQLQRSDVYTSSMGRWFEPTQGHVSSLMSYHCPPCLPGLV